MLRFGGNFSEIVDNDRGNRWFYYVGDPSFHLDLEML